MTTGLNSTLYRDIVYTEYMLEHDLTWTQMQERVHVDEWRHATGHSARGLSFLM